MVEGTGCAGHGEGPGIWHVRVWGGRRGLPTHHLPSSCEKASTVAAQLCAQKRQSDSASKHQSDKERQSIKVAKWQSGKAPTACASDTPAKHCTRAECNTVGHQSSGESSAQARRERMPCAKRRAMRASKVSKWQSGKVAKRPRPAQTTHRQALHKQEPSAAPSGTNRAVRAVHRQGDASGCCTERRGRVPPGGGSNQVEAAHPGSRALTSSEVTYTPQESLRARKRGRATDAGAWLGGQWGLFALVMRRDWGVPLARATAGRCSSVPQRQSWGARTQRTPSPFALEQAL